MAKKLWENRDFCRQVGVQPGLISGYNSYTGVTETAEDKYLFQSDVGSEKNISFMGMEACFRKQGYAEFILTDVTDVYIKTITRLEGGDGKTIVLSRSFFPTLLFSMMEDVYLKLRTVGTDFTVSYMIIAYQAENSM